MCNLFGEVETTLRTMLHALETTALYLREAGLYTTMETEASLQLLTGYTRVQHMMRDPRGRWYLTVKHSRHLPLQVSPYILPSVVWHPYGCRKVISSFRSDVRTLSVSFRHFHYYKYPKCPNFHAMVLSLCLSIHEIWNMILKIRSLLVHYSALYSVNASCVLCRSLSMINIVLMTVSTYTSFI